MKLYEVRNGYSGDGDLRCLVVAKSKKRAKELAEEKFEENARSIFTGRILYPKKYWKRLDVKILCSNTNIEYVGEVSE